MYEADKDKRPYDELRYVTDEDINKLITETCINMISKALDCAIQLIEGVNKDNGNL